MNYVDVKDKQWFKDSVANIKTGTFTLDRLARRLVHEDEGMLEDIHIALPYLILMALEQEKYSDKVRATSNKEEK